MFELQEIYPFWSGRRAAFVRATLLAGISVVQARLIDARWVIFSVVTTHEYDSLDEAIGEIISIASLEDGIAACHELLTIRTRELLNTNPSWARIGEGVLPRAVMAATGIVLEGDPMPVHICGAKVGNAGTYDAVYVRCYLCSSDGPAEPLTNMLEKLASDGPASLNDAFVIHLASIGNSQ